MIILVTRSTSLGWSDSWISQPPWVSDQGWSRQQEWGTTWSEIWKLMKICGLAQIVSLRYCKWIKTIDTIECYGIRLLRAIQATPRIIRACPESIMSHTFWSCVVVTPDGHLDWGGSWPGRSLRDSGKPIPGKQIQNFPSNWREIALQHYSLSPLWSGALDNANWLKEESAGSPPGPNIFRSRWPELFLDEVELLVLFW